MAKGTLRLVLAVLLMQALQISSAAGQQKKREANAIPASKSHMPKLYVVQNDAPRELPLEKTQLATTKNKPSSMKSLAADSAVTQAMQSGINTAAYGVASHVCSIVPRRDDEAGREHLRSVAPPRMERGFMPRSADRDRRPPVDSRAKKG